MTEEDLVYRKEMNLVIACTVTFCALFLVNYIDYAQRLQHNNYIHWDVKTLTSGDYTVEVDIGPKFYPKYERLVERDWIQQCNDFCICCNKCD